MRPQPGFFLFLNLIMACMACGNNSPISAEISIEPHRTGTLADTVRTETYAVNAKTPKGRKRCTNDCDCGFGAYCSAGFCENDFGPFFKCYCAARDCKTGICSGGSCIPSKGCNNDCDCPRSNFCIAGVCQPDDYAPPLECYCGYRDCGVDQYCAVGHCIDK